MPLVPPPIRSAAAAAAVTDDDGEPGDRGGNGGERDDRDNGGLRNDGIDDGTHDGTHDGTDDDGTETHQSDSLASPSPASSPFEVAALFATVINYIFGAGVLAVPYAIVHGGIVASSVLLVASSALALVGMMWILEVQERANAVLGQDSLVEYSQLCLMFLGDGWRRVYEVALSTFVISSAWMYCAISCISLSSTIPLFSDAGSCDLSAHRGPLWGVADKACWLDYCIYLCVFAAIMVFVVRMDIAKMQGLQLLMTCFGFSALLIMLATVAAAMSTDGIAPIDLSTELFNSVSFGAVFGTFVFAQLAHQGVPLLSYIPHKDKRSTVVPPVFFNVIATTTVLYLILGLLCGLYFGVRADGTIHPVNKLITLNWQDYGTDWGPPGAVSTAISFFVRLYPAITCGAAFPLYIITLGNAWKKAWSSSSSSSSSEFEASEDGNGTSAATVALLASQEGQHESQDQRQRAVADKNRWYLVAMVPPVFLAFFMADISFMLLLVGVCAILIAFIIPPLMQLKSRQAQGVNTSFRSHFSKPVYCYLCLAFGSVALVYTFLSQVL